MVLVSFWLLVFRNRFTIPNRKSSHLLIACLPAEPKSNGSGPHSDKMTYHDLGAAVMCFDSEDCW